MSFINDLGFGETKYFNTSNFGDLYSKDAVRIVEYANKNKFYMFGAANYIGPNIDFTTIDGERVYYAIVNKKVGKKIIHYVEPLMTDIISQDNRDLYRLKLIVLLYLHL